jgi:hypothetical protein
MTTTMTTEAATPYISKSKFLWGLQCRKLLWTAYNAKDLIPATDAQTQAIFDQGHEVGELAKQLFPGGIEIDNDAKDFGTILAASKQALKHRRPLYEAAFSYQGGYARVDILNPVDDDAWDIVEVKSSTSVKDVHIFDLAFQAFVYAGAGLKIRRCFLLLINSDYVRHGEIDPSELFQQQDVTDQVSAMSRQIEKRLEEMFGTIHLPDQPVVKIGPHCNDPYPCQLHEHCWEFLPEANVMTLYRGGAKGFKLLADGIMAISDIPDDFKLTANQEIQRRTAKTGQPYVDKPAIGAFLNQLKFPVNYLDFETFGTAIPLFDGVRPYQQVPFQFSLHVVRSPDTKPEHYKFLAEGVSDPRPEFMRRLQEVLPTEGSVVAFNAPFELARLQECCDLLPQCGPWVKNVECRIVDLLMPFRGFRYYHPKQNGSGSMKSVLPALTGKDYNHLAIQEGGTASREFLRVHFTDAPKVERQRVLRAGHGRHGVDFGGSAKPR